jgi:hypothetical protein
MFSCVTRSKPLTAEKELTVALSTRISKSMFEELKIVLPKSSHINKADYLRDLVRLDLKNRKQIADLGTNHATT